MESTEEAKERIAKFLEAYGKLTEEFKVDFVSYPMYVPDGEGAFKVILNQQAVDTKDRPVKSPFVAQG